MLKKLVKDGINIMTKDRLGNFTIHIAAQIGDNIISNILLRSNTSINATNYTWQTLLHLVAQNWQKDIFYTLKQHDFHDCTDRLGKTAEYYATENGHFKKLYAA